jgi:hypothetical protein
MKIITDVQKVIRGVLHHTNAYNANVQRNTGSNTTRGDVHKAIQNVFQHPIKTAEKVVSAVAKKLY